ncbi:hypothetical protein [Listeria booriae]|nr:hypothetical protein [Listeria booriae]MBC2259628.1 hypothetical protein [Listeria booriae]MBC6163023.1 hypothetical protein [Listeria booriae]
MQNRITEVSEKVIQVFVEEAIDFNEANLVLERVRLTLDQKKGHIKIIE